MVSRMIIGGSAGFKMMIALPRGGPADGLVTGGGLNELVDVGARASPAEEPPAYDLGVGHLHDPRHPYTIGMVAAITQVIVLTFGASRCSRGFRRRDHRRTYAAGVRSMARVSACLAASVHVGAACLEHQVGFIGLRQQSTPSWVISNPAWRALSGHRSPGDAHRPRSSSLDRGSLYSRSVFISRPDNRHFCLGRHVAPLIRTTTGPNPAR